MVGGEGFENVGVALENGGKVEVRACLNQTYYYCYYFDLEFSWEVQNVSLLYWDCGWGKRVHEIHFVGEVEEKGKVKRKMRCQGT